MIVSLTGLNAVKASLTETDCRELGDPLLCQFQHFSRFANQRTNLLAIQLRRGQHLVGLVPVVQLTKRSPAPLLVPSVARWIVGCLGPLAHKTTALVDTSFLAYDYGSPFRIAGDADLPAVANLAVQELQSFRELDSIMVLEPYAERQMAGRPDFDSFLALPMMHATTQGCSSLEEFVARMPKKRRRNYHTAVAAFQAAGAICEHYDQLPAALEAEVYRCLLASAARSEFHVPYQEVMTSREAFVSQPQKIIVARARQRVLGFATYVVNGTTLLQTHGGLDYLQSFAARAYQNLMFALIETAIQSGCSAVSFGPANNETKRRIADRALPMVASLWNRKRLDRRFARRLLIPSFRINQGALP